MALVLHLLWLLPLLAFVLIVSSYELDYLRALDDYIAYRVSFKSQAEEMKYQESSTPENWVSMTSADSEGYRCLLPTIQSNAKKRIETYSGPSPAELLQSVYDDHTCSYRIESYWLYEVCHGRYILQYHDDKETKTRTEYYLGNFAKVQAEAEAKSFDQLNPPMRKIGEDMLPYYPVTYGHGTNCDLTNKPRTTSVLYICDESAKNQVHSLNEVSSCNYEVVVLTNRLCAHPSFQKPPTKEHEIHCFPTEKEKSHPKPAKLLSMEKESTNSFFQEFSILKSSNLVSSTKNIFNRLMQADESDDEFDQLNMILEALKSSTKLAPGGGDQAADTGSGLTPVPQKAAPSASDLQLVEQFWKGRACLSGGSGWWKYEICYGRSVVQFHEESGKERVNIVLGVFHQEVHRQWAEENPRKAVKKENAHIYQVGNLYTQGDLCTETNTHRSCEVRIRCRDQTPTVSPSKVLIYLLEPDTCSYILVVESTLLCDGLQNVDETGLLPDMPQLQEFETLHEPRVVSSKEHVTKVQIIKDQSLDSLVSQPSAEEGQVQDDEGESDELGPVQPRDELNEKDEYKIYESTVRKEINHQEVLNEVREKLARYRQEKQIKKEKVTPSEEQQAIVEIAQSVADSINEKERSKQDASSIDQEQVITEIIQKFTQFNEAVKNNMKNDGVDLPDDQEQPTTIQIVQNFDEHFNVEDNHIAEESKTEENQRTSEEKQKTAEETTTESDEEHLPQKKERPEL